MPATVREQAEAERRNARKWALINGLAYWFFGGVSIVAGAFAGAGFVAEDSALAGIAGVVAGACGGLLTFGRFGERQKFQFRQGAAYGLIADGGGTAEELAAIRSRTL